MRSPWGERWRALEDDRGGIVALHSRRVRGNITGAESQHSSEGQLTEIHLRRNTNSQAVTGLTRRRMGSG